MRFNGSPFVLLDNIPDNTTIDSPSLAAALTTEEWSDRLLGRNNAIRLPSPRGDQASRWTQPS